MPGRDQGGKNSPDREMIGEDVMMVVCVGEWWLRSDSANALFIFRHVKNARVILECNKVPTKKSYITLP